jgi:hypothetical protein
VFAASVPDESRSSEYDLSMLNPQGYRHPGYAQVFREFATPVPLEHCGGWLLERSTPGLIALDAMGCYPIFSCSRWALLNRDLEAHKDRWVSLALVTDPFGTFRDEDLRTGFDTVAHFKDHLVTALAGFELENLSASTQRNLRKATTNLDVEICTRLEPHLDDWTELYAGLCRRHGIGGLRAFSRSAFEQMFTVPGLVMFKAMHGKQTVGLHTWMVDGDVAYGHLGATNALGSDLMASYALYWQAVRHFRAQLNWLDLGSAPGMPAHRGSGLLQFKRRWSTGCKPVYLCQRIFDQRRYDAIVNTVSDSNPAFFPAYRAGEFV